MCWRERREGVVVVVGGCSATAYEGKRMIGGIGHVLLSRPILKLIMVKIHWFLSVNLSSK